MGKTAVVVEFGWHIGGMTTGGLGATVLLKNVPYQGVSRRDDIILFSESNSRMLVEVAPVPAGETRAAESLDQAELFCGQGRRGPELKHAEEPWPPPPKRTWPPGPPW